MKNGLMQFKLMRLEQCSGLKRAKDVARIQIRLLGKNRMRSWDINGLNILITLLKNQTEILNSVSR